VREYACVFIYAKEIESKTKHTHTHTHVYIEFYFISLDNTDAHARAIYKT